MKKTKEKILDKGVELWRKGAEKVTSANIARELGITHQNVQYYFKDNLRESVADHAVKVKDRKVIVQLIMTEHVSVRNLSPSDRLSYLMG